MKRILTLLLASAVLIPSFSYANEDEDAYMCAENVYIQGISIVMRADKTKDKSSWKITYSTEIGGQRNTVKSDPGGSLDLNTDAGRTTYALAMNAMNMKQRIRVFDRNHTSGHGSPCRYFTMLMLYDTFEITAP